MQLNTAEFINGIVDEMSGAEGCGLDDEPEKCKKIVAQLIPVALPAIAEAFEDINDISTICNSAVPNIC